MAEAHSAVAFSFAITHEGVHVNYDREVLHVIWHSGVRSWRRSIRRVVNSVRCGVFPATLSSLALTITGYNAMYLTRDLHKSDIDPSFGLIDLLKRHIKLDEPVKGIVCCTVSGFAVWFGVFIFMKYTLRTLFLYKGWMYEARGKGRTMSVASRLWFLAVKMMTKFSRPMLYSYQGSLPRLPLPALDDTMKRYLRSVRPLMDDENYERMQNLALEFQKGIGKKLQRYLLLKSWWATNYVTDWWEEFVYLRGRSPIMVNSNFYGTDAILLRPTRIQAARAANVTHAAFLFRRLVDRQQLQPIMVQNTVPLCSYQYERTFNTSRVPGIQTDKIVHYGDSTHIAVYHAGRFFKMPCYYKGALLTPRELQIQFERILAEESVPEKGEAYLGALTAGERKPWAEARMRFFRKGVNAASLDIIERAAFVLVLEEEECDYDENDPSQLDKFGRTMLHGKGYDRWYDKSFNVIVMKNGKIGFNAEHSWADAPVMGHLWEYIMVEDIFENGYDSDGNCTGKLTCDPPVPTRLKWELNPECIQVIDNSFRVAESLLNDVDLRLYMHTLYGKGLMKKCRLSPDAYIQMALQLAYFRDAGKFNLTYEASMTRLFRDGRTETVRPCTIESAAWVKAMEDKVSTDEDRVTLLRKACGQHQRGYQDAMCGKGIDRHLFCLYVISKYLEVDSPFLNEVLSEPWRLSTSQTPHGQTNRMDLTKNPDCISAGGGFGPVADDGYGVSYIIAGEDTLFFHISSKKSSPVTDSKRFARHIEKALLDMKNLFESAQKK
ncbi:carnitine O-palmitoyltransferase 1, liver isoform-like [Penaeus monodon]|uniref:carnitine O-palmitoyltransferase 1, liver isoform-like n=1 Tax=Penaeus monodon TaxID=6687 RepID=UPI0018A740C0|nr:carnitine O-palmitoyltransferase 1, liver isoform-like [Penaeus monodon]XP_037788960.1 carnitine O-palmitoyltransferase 1, liver isoform-like [Penaeus monodon]